MTHCAESKENVKQPSGEFFSLLKIGDAKACMTIDLNVEKSSSKLLPGVSIVDLH